jgi:hypothetical protein
MKRSILATIEAPIAAGDYPAAIAAIDVALATETGSSWIRELGKIRALLVAGGHPAAARHTIIAVGNSKLPFLTFSALPGALFCPGAGDCLNWCYSFRAHRYPAAWARHAGNTILLNSAEGRAAIAADLDRAAAKAMRKSGLPTVTFRLYVDGDFRTTDEVLYWYGLLAARPAIHAYGYSKSWPELIAAGTAPSNYVLNLSGGSRHDDVTRADILATDVVRGGFFAVPMEGTGRIDHADRGHRAKLRTTYGKPAFTCPGKCGTCTPTGHACGSKRFAGVDIIIAIH